MSSHTPPLHVPWRSQSSTLLDPHSQVRPSGVHDPEEKGVVGQAVVTPPELLPEVDSLPPELPPVDPDVDPPPVPELLPPVDPELDPAPPSPGSRVEPPHPTAMAEATIAERRSRQDMPVMATATATSVPHESASSRAKISSGVGTMCHLRIPVTWLADICFSEPLRFSFAA